MRKALRRINPLRGRRLSPFKAGLVALVIVLIAVYFGFTKKVPFTHHFQVQAVFQTANNLKSGSPVRIAGVNVGEVTKVEHLHPGKSDALVTMQIQPEGRPIHKDATLKIRPRIFLEGNFFVDVFPGTPTAPTLGDGGRIPVKQTATPVQLDQILGALQSNTRQDLVTLLANFATALQGAGAQGYNRSLLYQKPAFQYSSVVNEALLGVRPHDLSSLIGSAGVVARALDRNPPALKSLITDFNTTAAAFARQQGNLEATVGELPVTLQAAQPALRALNNSFPHVDHLVADLRPTVRTTGPTIDATEPLLRQLNGLVSRPELRGLVADLRPTIPALARLNNRTVPLLGQVRLASSCQNRVILPWSRDRLIDSTFASHGPVYQEGVKFLPGLAGESRAGDANGQWFRVLATGGSNLLANGTADNATQFLGPLVGVNPQKPVRGGDRRSLIRPPIRRSVPCETQKQPDLRSVPSTQASASKTATPAQARKSLAVASTLEALQRGLGAKGLSKALARNGLTANSFKALGVSPRDLRRLASPAGGRSGSSTTGAGKGPAAPVGPTAKPRGGSPGTASRSPGLLGGALGAATGAGR